MYNPVIHITLSTLLRMFFLPFIRLHMFLRTRVAFTLINSTGRPASLTSLSLVVNLSYMSHMHFGKELWTCTTVHYYSETSYLSITLYMVGRIGFEPMNLSERIYSPSPLPLSHLPIFVKAVSFIR